MIHSFDYSKKNVADIAKVVEFRNSIVLVEGFKAGFVGEAVSFENDIKGVTISIQENTTTVLLFSNQPLAVGTFCARTNHSVQISVGDGILGHVVSALGYDLDQEKDPSKSSELRQVFGSQPQMFQRSMITKFLETGVSLVDTLFPIGQGQRELIIGDRKTGKSHFLYQVASNQAKVGKVVIYAFIGKKVSEINKAVSFFRSQGVLDRMVVVASGASDSSGEIYISPFSAMTLSEYFKDQGQDVVVILDDLTTHAKYYREISLLNKRFPTRESYPGDMFHIHAKLLERAGSFKVDSKDVSITAFPVAETYMGDFSGYIQTNLASITDGHLYFDVDLFQKGIRPAINVFLSVTRVGRQTLDDRQRKISGQALSLLKKHSEIVGYLKFGTEIKSDIKNTIESGNKIYKFLNQTGHLSRPAKKSFLELEEILNKS